MGYDGFSLKDVQYAPRPTARPKLNSLDLPARPPTQRLQSALGQALPDNPALAWRYAQLCHHIGSDYQRPYCADIARLNARQLSEQQRQQLQTWVDLRRKRAEWRPLPSRTRTNLMYSL